MKTVRECLKDYDTALLRAIAERRGVALATDRQPDMVEAIALALLNPGATSEALVWLTDQERKGLDTLLANGGRLSMYRFVQQFGEIRRLGPGSLAREAPWRAPISAAEGLWYMGLIARSFTEQDGVSVEFAFVPSDLIPLLPPSRTPQDLFDVPPFEPVHKVFLGDPALADDMCVLLALAQKDDVQAQQGQPSADVDARLREQFLDADPRRAEFLYHLAEAAGFVFQEGRFWRLHREGARDWLKRPRAEQLLALQRTWRDDPDWNDLWHVPGLACEDTGWRNDPLISRQIVLDLLRRCPEGNWLSIQGFVEAVHRQFPDYLRPDGDFDSWYIRDVHTGEYVSGVEHWEHVEGALLDFFLSGPLFWLGIVSLGYREGWQKPVAFQLTAWGKGFLGLSAGPGEELPPHPARITPDGRVTLPREASLFDRFQLARIAEWRASRPEYVYEITPEALRQAFGTRIRAEMVEKFLERISQESVPAAAVARIRAWAERYGQVRLRRTVILETRTSQKMAELRAHPRIRAYLRQPLSPTMALVRENDWDLLVQELERAGYLPEIVER